MDLLSWLPLLLIGDASVSIRLLRVLRLLKLMRYLRAMGLFLASLRDVLDLVLIVVAAIVVIAVIAGNLMHLIEPQTFANAFIGSWWGVVTMTTVGYGDLVPVTALGKTAAAALMILGITLFALLTATISAKVNQALGQRERCDACPPSRFGRATGWAPPATGDRSAACTGDRARRGRGRRAGTGRPARARGARTGAGPCAPGIPPWR